MHGKVEQPPAPKDDAGQRQQVRAQHRREREPPAQHAQPLLGRIGGPPRTPLDRAPACPRRSQSRSGRKALPTA